MMAQLIDGSADVSIVLQVIELIISVTIFLAQLIILLPFQVLKDRAEYVDFCRAILTSKLTLVSKQKGLQTDINFLQLLEAFNRIVTEEIK